MNHTVMKIYNIDFTRFFKLLLLTFLRGGAVLSALGSAAAGGLEFINALFTAYRAEVDGKLKYNYQVCYLEAMLNDGYDATQRRIYISTEIVREYLMIYQYEEDLPVMIYENGQGDPVMIHRTEEIQTKNVFIVNLPAELADKTEMVRASVNIYRLASREFIIKTF